MGALPQEERRKYCAEEERERKIELKVVKEHLWKRWKNKRGENGQKIVQDGEFSRALMEKKLEKLEQILERLKAEE